MTAQEATDGRPVLILGGGGFLGTNVTEQLVAAGRRVINVSRSHLHRDDGGAVRAGGHNLPSGSSFIVEAGESLRIEGSAEASDVLLFGPEPTGLAEAVLADSRITAQLRIPMLPGRRSMNLSNAAAVAVYEAWRQQGFRGGS